MDTAQTHALSGSFLEQKVEEQRAATLDQMEAAWQLYVSRVEEALSTGWKDHLERAVQERFGEIATAVGEAFTLQLDERVSEMRRAVRGELAGWFNESLRRMRRAGSQDEVLATLLELAGMFSDRAALMLVEQDGLRWTGARDSETGASIELAEAQIPLSAAPAMMSAAISKETTIAQITAEEISEPLAGFFAELGLGKAGLFPVVVADQAVAVLCAARREAEPDAGGLELLAMMAGMALESLAARARPTLVQIAGAWQGKAAPEWPALSRTDAEIHAAARRFARVQVAEMRLFKAQAVREGRLRQDLYSLLRQEIDAAREAYRASYLGSCPTMVDYLHLELVRTLANDDARLLGPEYPGPMV